MHINEIDHDDTSHIAESQLSCQLIGSTQVHIESICFLTFLTSAVATVYINYMQSLCVLDDEISTMFVVDNSSKSSLNLFGNAEIVEDRHLTSIEFNYARLFRGY
ncbi:putative uncharacterized protein [Prevotella sp. CAG:604]|nr:putative uncharacterized protein [Prevotella sp. CAG:604]